MRPQGEWSDWSRAAGGHYSEGHRREEEKAREAEHARRRARDAGRVGELEALEAEYLAEMEAAAGDPATQAELRRGRLERLEQIQAGLGDDELDGPVDRLLDDQREGLARPTALEGPG